ncbi:hypothetical protein CF327_g1753 [Tilletia walkeri]|uniref:RlpA-like protein double-psi beta-barrel domain-containing protein n=1 Tax=Tilletia walkeri TaxID=117179 RepID=A0A8X7T787_9BASI|nr:hypothetical protein CF327_g1753 [Tilletia walkeri]KAE8270613.1 hypothetical protein A4X09_0g1718 [Tilletia walkeri]
MRFQLTTLLAFAAALVAAHPSVEAVADASDIVLRDTNTHMTEFDGRDFAKKDLHKRKRIVYKNAMITYYYGRQLNAPACGGPTPSEWDAIAAVKLSHGKAKCGDELHVHWKGKMVNVKVVDDCGSCNENELHVDLSRGMFRKLDNLDVGVLTNAHVRVIHKNRH